MAPKKLTIDRIETDEKYAAASTILRTLEDGLRDTERTLDSLRIETHLAQRPADPNAADLKGRLRRNREASPAARPEARDPAGIPASIRAALELLRDGVRPPRRDRTAEVRQLETDIAIIRTAIIEQTQVVTEIRGALSASLADQLCSDHRALVLAQFRALQAAAGACDDLRAFRSNILAAGFEFFGDRLPEPVLRSMLIAGSERDWDSEVSRCRRLLETLEILK